MISFEKLKLEKFSSNELKSLMKIRGGADPNYMQKYGSDCVNGGCVCDTQGGIKVFPDLSTYIYKSDIALFDQNGVGYNTDWELGGTKGHL